MSIHWVDDPGEVEDRNGVFVVKLKSGAAISEFAMSPNALQVLLERGKQAVVQRARCAAEVIPLAKARRQRRKCEREKAEA